LTQHCFIIHYQFSIVLVQYCPDQLFCVSSFSKYSSCQFIFKLYVGASNRIVAPIKHFMAINVLTFESD